MSQPQPEATPSRERAPEIPIPPKVPVVYLVSTVIFPGGTAQAQLRTPRNLDLLAKFRSDEQIFAFAFAPGADPEKLTDADLGRVAVLGRVISRLNLPDGSLQVAMQGIRRVLLKRWLSTSPVFLAETAAAVESDAPAGPAQEVILSVLELVETLVRYDEAYSGELVRLLQSNVDEPGRFADLVALTVAFDLRERQAVLQELDVAKRLRLVEERLREKVEVARIAREIEQKARGDISKAQREYFLRQQIKAIRSELGEDSREEADARRFTEKADAATLPPEVDRVVRAEIDRVRMTSAASAEYNVVLNYLDWLLAMPWTKESEDRLDVARVRRALDRDHYGLEKPKRRILEYLSVRALAPQAPGPILCFVGPPGTGKTSLAQSIAGAMGRALTRISVGGIQDESQIRGHRRTYVGAMPGRIVQAIRRCGTRNPVMVIDEIDKMGAGPQGDPSAALLEVLDPEQNKSFTDHYMDVPFDLSRVLFVTTANYPFDIPGPLMDRMEVVSLSGYTESEKVIIARRHLVPKALAHTGTKGRVRIAPSCVRAIIRHYTAEAGVRDLGRRLEEVCRKYAVRIAGGKRGPFAATAANVESVLGRPPVSEPERRTEAEVGVVTGLAWTPYGGDLLVIEAIRMPGDGSFALTGSLGSVMKESVQAAASWVRAHASWLGIPLDSFGVSDVHVHFPEGAVPKDGPSAGVAITVALASVFTGLRVRHDVAMTGEVTLRGKVLPIGGLREKLTAAYRGGLREVFIPKDNLAELEEVPEEVRRALKVTGASSVEEVLKAAIIAPKGGKNRRLGMPDRRQGAVPR